MARSFDDLLDFLLAEIALCGSQGASSADFQTFVRKFYEHSNVNSLPHCDNFKSSTVNASLDDDFLERIWDWVTSHQDIQVIYAGERRDFSFREFNAIESQNAGSSTTGPYQRSQLYPRQSRTARNLVGQESEGSSLSVPDTSFSLLLHETLKREGHVLEVPRAVPSQDLEDRSSSIAPAVAIAVDRTESIEHNVKDPTSMRPRSQDIGHIKTSVQGTKKRGRRKTGRHGIPALEPVFEEPVDMSAPRIYASQDRSWQAIAGHSVDYKRLPHMEFVLLSIIASRGSEGILQPELVKVSGQDKRSVPHRTDMLAQKGYINKKAASTMKTRTSVCVHTKFAKDSRLSPQTVDLDNPETLFDNKTLIYHNFITYLCTLLRQVQIVSLIDLRAKMGVQLKTWRGRAIKTALMRLENGNLIKRVKARSRNKENSWLVCVKLLREPNEDDYTLLNFRRKNIPAGNYPSSHILEEDEEGDDLMRDLELDVDFDDDDVPTNEDGDNDSHDLHEVDRIPPQWSPDRQVTNMVFDAIAMHGMNGCNSSILRDVTVGKFWKRPVESYISRMTDNWEVSQPVHLRHLAAIRDTTVTQEKKFVHYIYRTYGAFQKAAEAGEVSWEAVSNEAHAKNKNPKNSRQKNSDKASQKAQIDERGFPKPATKRFLSSHGSPLADCVNSIPNAPHHKDNWAQDLLKRLGIDPTISRPPRRRVTKEQLKSATQENKEARRKERELKRIRAAAAKLAKAEAKAASKTTAVTEPSTQPEAPIHVVNENEIGGAAFGRGGQLPYAEPNVIDNQGSPTSPFTQDDQSSGQPRLLRHKRQHTNGPAESTSRPSDLTISPEAGFNSNGPSTPDPGLLISNESTSFSPAPLTTPFQSDSLLRTNKGDSQQLPAIHRTGSLLPHPNSSSAAPPLYSTEPLVKLRQGENPKTYFKITKEERLAFGLNEKGRVPQMIKEQVLLQRASRKRLQILGSTEGIRGVMTREGDSNEYTQSQFVVDRHASTASGNLDQRPDSLGRASQVGSHSLKNPIDRMNVLEGQDWPTTDKVQEIAAIMTPENSTPATPVPRNDEYQPVVTPIRASIESQARTSSIPSNTEHGTYQRRYLPPPSISANPPTGPIQLEDRIEEIVQGFLDRPGPGVYINPFATRKIPRGRPRRALMAIFKTDRLRKFPWFQPSRPTTPKPAQKRRPPSSAKKAIDVTTHTGHESHFPNELVSNVPQTMRTETDPEEANETSTVESGEGGHSTSNSLVVVLKYRKPRARSPSIPQLVIQPVPQSPARTPSFASRRETQTPKSRNRGAVANAPVPGTNGTLTKRGVVLGKGTSYLFRTKLVMEIMERCDGVYPGAGDIYEPFYRLWDQRAPRELLRPDRTTLLKAIRELIMNDQLRKVTFSFSTSYGAAIMKDLFALPHLDVLSPQVRQLQANIKASYPKRYIPEQVRDLIPQQKPPRKSVPHEYELAVDSLYPVEQLLKERIKSTTEARRNQRRNAAAAAKRRKEIQIEENRQNMKNRTLRPKRLETFKEMLRPRVGPYLSPYPPIPRDSKSTSESNNVEGDWHSRVKDRDVDVEVESTDTDEGLVPEKASVQASDDSEPDSELETTTPHAPVRFKFVPGLVTKDRAFNHQAVLTSDSSDSDSDLEDDVIPKVFRPRLHASLYFTKPITPRPEKDQSAWTERYVDSRPKQLSSSISGVPGPATVKALRWKPQQPTLQTIHERKSSPDNVASIEKDGFVNLGPSDFDPGYETNVIGTITDPGRQFHPSTGTFSTEFTVTRNARHTLWIDPVNDQPRSLAEIIALGFGKDPQETVRFQHEALMLAIPEHRKFYADVNNIVAWEQQYFEKEFLFPLDLEDPFINLDFPGKHTTATGYGFYVSKRWVYHFSDLDETFTLRKKRQSQRGRRRKVRIVERDIAERAPDSEPRKKRIKYTKQALPEDLSELIESDLDDDVSSSEEEFMNRRFGKRASQPKRTSPLRTVTKQQKMATLTERLTGLFGVDTQPLPPRTRTATFHRKGTHINQSKPKTSVKPPERHDKFKTLLYTLVISACMDGNDGTKLNWSVVKNVYGGRHGISEAKVSASWEFIRKHMATEVRDLTTIFQARFIAAYEMGDLPCLDNFEEYDWERTVDWAIRNCPIVIAQLPADRGSLFNFDIAESEYKSYNRGHWYTYGISGYVKEQKTLRYSYAAPIHQPAKRSRAEETLLRGRSLVVSNIATPEANYKSKIATQRLGRLGETVLTEVVNDFVERKIIKPKKARRILPGRNFQFTSQQAHDFRRILNDNDFMEAVKFKKHLDEMFSAEDPANRRVIVDPTSSDGAIMALLDLLGNGRVHIIAELPPINNAFHAPHPRLSVWGFLEGDYRSRLIDRARFFWPIVIVPTGSYRFGSILPGTNSWDPLPPPPLPDPNNPDTLIPIWCCIDASTLIPDWWNRALNVVLQAVVFQSGTSPEDISHTVNSRLETFEVEMVLQWLEGVGAAIKTRGGKWMVSEGWWCVFGDEINYSEDDWVGKILRKKRTADGQGWRSERQRLEGLGIKKQVGRPRKHFINGEKERQEESESLSRPGDQGQPIMIPDDDPDATSDDEMSDAPGDSETLGTEELGESMDWQPEVSQSLST